MNYESSRTIESTVCEGVHFRIARISFARRLELMRRVRELGRRIEFEQAGDDIKDKIEGAIACGEIDRLYLEGGLLEVQGLTVDSEVADVNTVVERGPELLCREIVRAIRHECGLSEEERKN